MNFWNQLTVPTIRFEYNFTIRKVWMEVIIYSGLAFLIPFIIGSPQLVIGAAVNTLLVMAALNLKQSHWLPIAILPSLGALAGGILWGPFIYYLLYFVPFIWVANILFISLIQYNISRNHYSYWVSLLFSAVLKTVFLSIASLALFAFDIIPQTVLLFMSLFQLLTALSGGLIATGVQAIIR